MKQQITFILLFISLFHTRAQQFTWATAVSGSQYEYGTRQIRDNAGNTYMLGYGSGGPIVYNGVSYPTNGAGGDVFFAKLGPDNALLWLKTLGGDDDIYNDEAFDMHMDQNGDIYLAVRSASYNFTYNGQVLGGINSIGQYGGEAVLLKVNANGDYLWHDSGSVSSEFRSIDTDADGNVYITGNFARTVTLGGSITLTNPSEDTTRDLLVAKYQPDGTIVWAKNAGGMPHNTFAYGYGIRVHPQTGEVLVLCKAEGEVLFEGTPFPAPNGSDQAALLVSYGAGGQQNWIRRVLDVNNISPAYGGAMTISDSGIIGICGYYYHAAMIGFYTAEGTVISEQNYPAPNLYTVQSIAFNENDEAYVSGWGYAGAVLGVDPDSVTLTSTTGFIAKLDLLQRVKWIMEFEGQSTSQIIYQDGLLLYAGRIDDSFPYNYGQGVIQNNAGDALFGVVRDFQVASNRCDIKGSVFQDVDGDCVQGVSDVAQKSVIVQAEDASGLRFYSITDAEGNYDIPVNVGTYTVTILPNPVQSPLIAQNCLTQHQVTTAVIGQDVTGVNFPIEIAACPLLNVEVNSDRRRRCFESNTYVTYSNLGFASQEDVEVKVSFPEYVSFVSSDYPHVIDAEGNYVFSIGMLAPNESGEIHIIDRTECVDGITGLTQCTKAWITPQNTCADSLDPDYPAWDRSTVKITGKCVDDTMVRFTLTNSGLAMQSAREYRIYVDNALSVTNTYQLVANESLVVDHPANGQTIRLEADQDPMHPGNSQPSQTVEACGGINGVYSTGFVNRMPMDDLDEDVEIHCLEIIDSFDPNDKSVTPSGITENHFVKAGTTLDYMIRFQNTGSDTAYKIVVTDVLPPYLDPSTIQFGVSSHPYTLAVSGTDTPALEFTFTDINLPHSAVDEPGSNGFLTFRAKTYETLENGIAVDNNANIYFDYNYPILTNTASVTISDLVLIYDPLGVTSYQQEKIRLYPNPTSGLINIQANGYQEVNVYNFSGQFMERDTQNQIDLSPYPKGIYFVNILTEEGSAVKKIIVH